MANACFNISMEDAKKQYGAFFEQYRNRPEWTDDKILGLIRSILGVFQDKRGSEKMPSDGIKLIEYYDNVYQADFYALNSGQSIEERFKRFAIKPFGFTQEEKGKEKHEIYLLGENNDNRLSWASTFNHDTSIVINGEKINIKGWTIYDLWVKFGAKNDYDSILKIAKIWAANNKEILEDLRKNTSNKIILDENEAKGAWRQILYDLLTDPNLWFSEEVAKAQAAELSRQMEGKPITNIEKITLNDPSRAVSGRRNYCIDTSEVTVEIYNSGRDVSNTHKGFDSRYNEKQYSRVVINTNADIGSNDNLTQYTRQDYATRQDIGEWMANNFVDKQINDIINILQRSGLKIGVGEDNIRIHISGDPLVNFGKNIQSFQNRANAEDNLKTFCLFFMKRLKDKIPNAVIINSGNSGIEEYMIKAAQQHGLQTSVIVDNTFSFYNNLGERISTSITNGQQEFLNRFWHNFYSSQSATSTTPQSTLTNVPLAQIPTQQQQNTKSITAPENWKRIELIEPSGMLLDQYEKFEKETIPAQREVLRRALLAEIESEIIHYAIQLGYTESQLKDLKVRQKFLKQNFKNILNNVKENIGKYSEYYRNFGTVDEETVNKEILSQLKKQGVSENDNNLIPFEWGQNVALQKSRAFIKLYENFNVALLEISDDLFYLEGIQVGTNQSYTISEEQELTDAELETSQTGTKEKEDYTRKDAFMSSYIEDSSESTSSKEVKRLLASIPDKIGVNNGGRVKTDALGNIIYIDKSKAHGILINLLSNMIDENDLLEILEEKQIEYGWIRNVIEAIKKDDRLFTAFYIDMMKANNLYVGEIIKRNDNGSYNFTTPYLNAAETEKHQLDIWDNTINSGVVLDKELSIYTENGEINNINKLSEFINELLKEYISDPASNLARTEEERIVYAQTNEGFKQKVKRALAAVGIQVENDNLLEIFRSAKKLENPQVDKSYYDPALEMLQAINGIVVQLGKTGNYSNLFNWDNIAKRWTGKEGLLNLTTIFNGYYKSLASLLASSDETIIEDSLREGNKTIYAHVNINFISLMNRILKDVRPNKSAPNRVDEKINQTLGYAAGTNLSEIFKTDEYSSGYFKWYMYEKYGKFEFFRDQKEKDLSKGWKIPVLNQLYNDKNFRNKFDLNVIYKVVDKTTGVTKEVEDMDENDVLRSQIIEFMSIPDQYDVHLCKIQTPIPAEAGFRYTLNMSKLGIEEAKEVMFNITMQELGRIFLMRRRRNLYERGELGADDLTSNLDDIKGNEKNPGSKFNFFPILNEARFISSEYYNNEDLSSLKEGIDFVLTDGGIITINKNLIRKYRDKSKLFIDIVDNGISSNDIIELNLRINLKEFFNKVIELSFNNDYEEYKKRGFADTTNAGISLYFKDAQNITVNDAISDRLKIIEKYRSLLKPDDLKKQGEAIEELREGYERNAKTLEDIYNLDKNLTGIIEYLKNETVKNFIINTDISNKIYDIIDNIENGYIDNVKKEFFNFWLNFNANHSQIIELLTGDPAQYKDFDEMIKRLKEYHAPGLKFNTQATWKNKKTSVFEYKDRYGSSNTIEPSNSKEVEHFVTLEDMDVRIGSFDDMHNILLGRALNDQERDFLDVFFSKVTIADGQSFLSLFSMRRRCIMANKWSDELETSFAHILRGNYRIHDITTVMEALKPYTFSKISIETKLDDGTIVRHPVSIQHKTAETVLLAMFPILCKGTPYEKNNKLIALAEWMQENDIDVVNFRSCVKTGARGVVDLNYVQISSLEGSQKIEIKDSFSEADKNLARNISFVERVYKNKTYKIYTVKGETVKIGNRKYWSLEDALKDAKVNQDEYNEAMASFEYGSLSELDDDRNIEYVKEILNTYSRRSDGTINTNVIQSIPYSDVMIQTPLPEHFIDATQLIGAQIQQLITADMDKDARIKVPEEFLKGNNYVVIHGEKVPLKDGTLSKQQLVNLMTELLVETIIDNYYDESRGVDSSLTLDRLEKILQEQTDDLDVKISCTLKRDNDGTPIGFNIPLFDPSLASKTMALILSVVKKRVVKRKISGGTLVQASNYGYTNDLHVRFFNKEGKFIFNKKEWESGKAENPAYQKQLEEIRPKYNSYNEYKSKVGSAKGGSIAYAEVYAPINIGDMKVVKNYLKKVMVNGVETEVLDIEKMPDDLRTMLGYRIPTEYLYSSIPLFIKGFVPSIKGNTVIAAEEWMALTGSDFDADKIYVMNYGFRITRDNKIEKLQYDYSKAAYDQDDVDVITSTDEISQSVIKDKNVGKKRRLNALLDLMIAVLQSQDAAPRMAYPGGFLDQTKAARVIDIIKGHSPMEILEIFGINPNAEDAHKKLIEKIKNMNVDELTKIYRENVSQLSPSNPINIARAHQRVSSSGKMTGVCANHNINHAVAQNTMLGINENFAPMINGFRATSLHSSLNYKDELIYQSLAQYLAASVDDVKAITFGPTNVGEFTINQTLLLSRLGYDHIFIALLNNQPIIKLAQAIKSENPSLTELAALDMACARYKKSLPKEVAEKVALQAPANISFSMIKDYNFTTEEMLYNLMYEDEIENQSIEKQVSYAISQIYIYAMYKNQTLTCFAMRDFINYCRSSTANGSCGKDIATTNQKAAVRKKILDAAKKPTYPLTGVVEAIGEEIDIDDKDTARHQLYDNQIPLQSASFAFSFDGSARILKQFFPYYGDAYNNIVQKIRELSSAEQIEPETESAIQAQLMLYCIMLNPEFYDVRHMQNQLEALKFILAFANQIDTIKRTNPYYRNSLIKRLSKKKLKDNVNVLQLYNSQNIKKGGKVSFQDAWESLFNSANVESNEIAKVLHVWAGLKGAFRYGPGNIGQLTNSKIKQKNAAYWETIERINTELTFDHILNSKQIEEFIIMFIKNNLFNKDVAAQIKEKDIKAIGAKTNSITKVTSVKEIVKIPSDNVPFALQTRDQQGVRRFFTVTLSNKKTVSYELVGFENGQYIYIRIKPLGIPKQLLIYLPGYTINNPNGWSDLEGILGNDTVLSVDEAGNDIDNMRTTSAHGDLTNSQSQTQEKTNISSLTPNEDKIKNACK